MRLYDDDIAATVSRTMRASYFNACTENAWRVLAVGPAARRQPLPPPTPSAPSGCPGRASTGARRQAGSSALATGASWPPPAAAWTS